METLNMLFTQSVPGIGIFEIRAIDLAADAAFLHQWVTQPYAQYWGMLHHSYDEFVRSYEALLAPDHYKAFIGLLDGTPVFLMEQYDPAQDVIADFLHTHEGDTGMHVLVAPPVKHIPGFTTAVFFTIMDFLFGDPAVRRVIVEPDVRNDNIHALNKKAGFTYQKQIQLPHKQAWLAICNRMEYAAAKQGLTQPTNERNPYIPSALAWQKANRELICKAIGELAHELVLVPEILSTEAGVHSCQLQSGNVVYRFDAALLDPDHWHIDRSTLFRTIDDSETALDTLQFIREFNSELHIPEAFLSTYLEEITSTLYSKAYQLEHERFTAQQLVEQDFQTIEHAMMEGHPCFIANGGRIGFGSSDFNTYAPESDAAFALVWLAGRKDVTTFSSVNELDYEQFIAAELSETDREKFRKQLLSRGFDPDNYCLLPVHPWQWDNKISRIYTSDLTDGKLVFLGESSDRYSPQQSIRTLYNISHPAKHYTKTALAILNMGFLRGLSAHYMKSTPAITTWINRLLHDDPVLAAAGFRMLDEVATIGYTSDQYGFLGYRDAHNKMLAALWRQPPGVKLNPHQKAFTMAALLHVDSNGEAFLKHLIAASGLSTENWIRAYLNAYLVPIIHCLYRYDLTFMPHGENVLLVMENHVPVGILMKDITEEIQYFDREAVLPEAVERVRVATNDEMQTLNIYTDVFDCFFRFLAAILDKRCGYPSALFWSEVDTCIRRYQAKHPELQAQFERLDLLQPTFKRCCLNRLQLSNTKHMLDLSNPIESLKLAGDLTNPLVLHSTVLAYD